MSQNHTATTPLHILKLRDVQGLVKLSRSTIYAKVKTGEFPAPVKLSVRSSGWISRDVNAWLESLIKAPQQA